MRYWRAWKRTGERCDHRSPDGNHRCQLVRDHSHDIHHVAQVNGEKLCWYGVVFFPAPRHGQLPWAPSFPRDET